MATVPYTQFLPEVLPFVRECPEPVAINAIRNACIEFCTGSMYWQETQDATDLVSTSFPYTPDSPFDAQTVQTMGVYVDGRPLGTTTQDELDSKIISWRDATGAPRVFFQYNPSELGVYPLPDVSTSFIFRVSFAPTRDSTTVIDFVYDKYSEGIASGALARLLQVPGQAWSNPQLGAYHRQLFNNAMTNATVEASKSFTRKALRVQFNPV